MMRDSLGILLDTPQAAPVPGIQAPKTRDSLGILSGTTSPGPVPAVNPIDQGPAAPKPGAPKIRDSLGILSGTPAPAPALTKPNLPAFDISDVNKEIDKRAMDVFEYRYRQTQGGRPKEEINAELGGVEVPFIDPIDAATAAFGGGAKFAISRGAKPLNALARGAVAAIPAAGMEFPIGATVDKLSGNHPEIALLTAIGLGLASGLTVENLAERGLLRAARSLTAKYPTEARKLLPSDVVERFKSSAPASEWTPQISDRQTARMEKWKTKAAERSGQAPIEEPEIPWSRSGGTVEDVVVSHTSREKPFRDSLNILNPPKDSTRFTRDTIESAREGMTVAQREAQETRRARAANAGNFRQWVAETGGVNPNDPSFRGELRDLTSDYRGGRKVRTVPPGFFNHEAQSIDARVQHAIEDGWLPRNATEGDFFDALETNPTKRLSDLESGEAIDEMAMEAEAEYRRLHGLSEDEEIPAPQYLFTHPSVITGPMGGIAAGVDWEALKERGEVVIDPKKALFGAIAGAAGGMGARKAKDLALRMSKIWDKKFAEPFLNFAKQKANGLIVNEDIRRYLGMGRSQEFKDLMRNFKRETETLWHEAAEIGRELQQIAPTAAEQKRLMQVVKGSITGNQEMNRKATRVRELFNQLREKLKENELLEQSRFDKLTRGERAKIRKMINAPDPEKMDFSELVNFAQTDLGMNLSKLPRNATRETMLKAVQDELNFHRDRLQEHYHTATAGDYAPIYYRKHEGLSPEQRKLLQDEINRLKVKSRRGNPEGKQEIEALISRFESMLGEGAEARKQQRITHHQLVKGYAHQRLDMPIEVQRMLGLIEEAPFPVAKGLGTQQTDIRKAKLFQDVADHPGWAIRPRRNVEIPSNYRLVEDERFGVLNGLYVRKDIWDDLKEVEEWRGAFTRNWDKYLGWWKYGKVVLNPSTHARNFYSNMILAYLGDVSPTDVKTYSKASNALKGGEKNKWYAEAKKWGLWNNTFYSAEIGKLRDELASVRDPSKLKNWIRKAMSAPAAMYQGNEKFFKLAVFIKARESGMSVDEAARKAQHFLFEYGDVPPVVKHLKRWVSPFFTFTWKAGGLLGEMAIRKPWKVAAVGGAMYGMEELSKHALGLSDEEAAKERALLPEWQKRKAALAWGPYTQVLMPWQDKWGNNLYLDLSYVIPYGSLSEKWGQSALPLSDFLPSNPLFTIAAAIMTNKEGFTGRPIYNEVLDGAAQITGKYLEYAWRELTPSMAPGGYSWNKLKTGLQNALSDDKKVLDWADRPLELQTAILSSVFGIKLTPADEKKLKEFELRKRKEISQKVAQEIGRLKWDFQKNKIDRKEYEEEARKLKDLKRQLLMERLHATDPNRMSQAEYNAWREKGGGK